MRVFLTGATGFIGRPLAAALVARGWTVVALVRRPESAEARAVAAGGAICVAGDVTDRESMRAAMAGADLVVHNAGHYELGVDAPGRERMTATNVAGTDHVLGLARELGVPRTLYVSTAFAFGDTGAPLRDETFVRTAPVGSHYERTKTEAHALALEHQRRGLDLVIACPNGVIGPNDHSVWGYFVRLYVNGLMPPVAWAPDAVYSLVHVDDLVGGLVLAAERGRLGETYFLCGESRPVREHLGFWGLRPGAMAVRAWLPAGLAKWACWPVEPFERMAGLPAVLSRESVTASTGSLNYSSGKAKRELGWTHRTAERMWLDTIDGELALLRTRARRDLRSRLRPVEPAVA